jgi:hypothetical protein
MPLEVSFFDADWNKTTRRLYLNSGCGEYYYSSLDFTPVYIALDFEEKMADAGMSEYKIINRVGTNSFSELGLRFRVSEITDSVLFRPILHFAPPTPQTGITLSNTHYWKVEGLGLDKVTDGYLEFVYEGRQSSSFAADWDLDLLAEIDQADLRIFHRDDARSSWEVVTNVEHKEYSGSGNFKVYDIKTGEYAIGVMSEVALTNNYIDHATCYVLNVEDKLEANIGVYPNPSTGELNFGRVIDKVEIYSIEGVLLRVDTNIKASTIDFPKGVYLLKMESDGTFYSRKVMIN